MSENTTPYPELQKESMPQIDDYENYARKQDDYKSASISQVPSDEELGVSEQESIVQCGGCQNLLKFPKSAFIVNCPICNTNTVAESLKKDKNTLCMQCGACTAFLLIPRNCSLIACDCGAVNQVPSGF
ncbi:unnamed protein product [Moneuplotes crassus]|uniref:Zinc finger LSD1-type domain-containing protein n=1 Tax=Euplotes crassus TaxID=5936 RepID=A0AAD1XX77_EUPCR|nr:unnamed protein product [Moneuplotes crassus]